MAAKTKQAEASSAVRLKTDQMKKSETLREIHKLAIQIQALESEKGTHIYSKRSDFYTDFRQLAETDNKHTTERKTEGVKLRQQLDKINHIVKRFQRELKDVKPTPEFVEKLKMIMEDVEATINAFKEQQRNKYEELMKDERITSQELQALEKRFEAWSKVSDVPQSSRITSSKPLASARDITKDLPPEVAQFETFLQQTGGVRGGWDEYDHQTFLKFRIRYKGKIVFVDHLKPALPTRTEEEIREHESWYEEYLFLNDVKKDSIKKWRIQKEEHKDEVLSRAHEDVESSVHTDEQSSEKTQIERHEKLIKLNAWKVQKELEKAQESERKLRLDLAVKKKKEEDRKRQLAIKVQVEENRRLREEEEEYLKRQQEMWEEEETDRKKQISSREIAKFRERDMRVVYEKVQKEREQKEMEKEKERRLERIKQQIEADVSRDPNRLTQPTQGWKEKLKHVGPSGSGPVLHMPHRAVPSWRKGMH